MKYLTSFLDPITALSYNITSFHHDVFYFILLILIFVYWNLYKILKDYSWYVASKQRGLLKIIYKYEFFIHIQSFICYIWLYIFKFTFYIYYIYVYNVFLYAIKLSRYSHRYKNIKRILYFFCAPILFRGTIFPEWLFELTLLDIRYLFNQRYISFLLFPYRTFNNVFIDLKDNLIRVQLFRHNLKLEFLFAFFPTVIIGLIVFPSIILLYSLDEEVDPALTVKVIGHQWYWTYQTQTYKFFPKLTEVRLDEIMTRNVRNIYLSQYPFTDINIEYFFKLNGYIPLEADYFTVNEPQVHNKLGRLYDSNFYLLETLKKNLIYDLEINFLWKFISKNIFEFCVNTEYRLKKEITNYYSQPEIININKILIDDCLDLFTRKNWLSINNDLYIELSKFTSKIWTIELDSYQNVMNNAILFKGLDEFTTFSSPLALPRYINVLHEVSESQPIEFDSVLIQDNDLKQGEKRLLTTDKPLIIPSKCTIRFIITSDDVLHSWAIPEFGIKVDAVPGRLNQVIVNVEKPGRYYGQCSELCGVAHGFMPIMVDVYPWGLFTKKLK